MKEKYAKIKRGNKEYYIGYYVDIFQKRHQTSASTIKELEKKLQQREIDKRLQVCNNRTKFAEYLWHFMQTVHFNNKKSTTKARYVSTYNTHIKDCEIAKVPLCDLSIEMMQEFFNLLYQRSSEQNVKNVRKLISPCLRYAYGKGDIVRDFSRQLVIPIDRDEKELQNTKEKVHPLTVDEHLRFIQYIHGDRDEALYRLAIDGGYRKGELLALTWGDIDFVRRRISISKTYSYVKDNDIGKLRGVTSRPKTSNSIRNNALPNILIPILQKHKIEQANELADIGIEQTLDTLVFATPIGTHLDPSNINKKLKIIFADLGIDSKKHFHDLRHTYATRQFEIGTEPLVVSRMLGHSDVNITLRTYIHVLENLRDATADNTDEMYANMLLKSQKRNANVIPFPRQSDEILLKNCSM